MPRGPRSIASTVAIESTHEANEKSGSASSAATNASAAGATSAFASMMLETPKARAVRTWPGVASVSPVAPASSCRNQSAGAIVVLPCGMSSMPCAVAHAWIVAAFRRSASASSTVSGVQNSSSRGEVSRNSRTVRPSARSGSPVSLAASTSSARSSIRRGIRRPLRWCTVLHMLQRVCMESAHPSA